MSWGLGWKRSSEIFHLTLDYGDYTDADERQPSSPPPPASSSPSFSASSSPSCSSSPTAATLNGDLGFRIDLDWSAGDDEDQVALRLQSQLMVALPPPHDAVSVDLIPMDGGEEGVRIEMRVVRRREALRSVRVSRAPGSALGSGDGGGVLARLIRSNLAPAPAVDGPTAAAGVPVLADHWRPVAVLSLCNCGLSVLPVELTRLPLLEKLYLDNNKLSVLPPEVGALKNMKVMSVNNNMLVSVPVEMRQCVMLEELSLEHNKLVRPLLDFRSMPKLRILRLFGNPLEFLPEILPLHNLRHLTLANIRIEAVESLKSVTVQIETENSSYFIATRHKLSAFFSLVFRFSSCHHPLLASALAKIMEDRSNHVAISKEENAVRQLISMISSDNRHVVEQACLAISSLASDIMSAMQLIKCDIMKPIEAVLKSSDEEELVSVLQVVVTLTFVSDHVAQKMLTRDVLKSLKALCAHKNSEVQRLSLFAVGNLAFCLETRRTLMHSESLRDLLIRLTHSQERRVGKAAARALAILGENENLRRAIKGRPVAKKGLRILSMDGGGMKGLATVQMLKQIEQGTGKRIHEMFDLICGTSTGGMLAMALGIKQMTLDQCEEIYTKLGKLVFTEPIPKDEAATWKEKIDQLFKSSSQSFRVVVHGSKHSADQFERLLKEMCADEDGDLLIESAVKGIPKVFAVSTLVSVMPAQPYIFRNYQYPPGTLEVSPGMAESPSIGAIGTAVSGAPVGIKRGAFMGSCKHRVWEAIRASSAAPYYLDDFAVDANRWQDGAIVANNPTIFAIREAQLLWPDTRIDCLVSIGCGSVPTKSRRGGWRYLDTGQVLIESACSVERVEETLDTLIPMLPEMQYFRFNPVDERCGMELDETDPTIWLKLEAATEEYIQKNFLAFKNLCELLVPRYPEEEKSSDIYKSLSFSRLTSLNQGFSESNPTLGWSACLAAPTPYLRCNLSSSSPPPPGPISAAQPTMDDTCAVCAETLEWVAYGLCGHRDVCSTCVVRLRFVMDDNKCCICKTICPSVFVTKALGEYTRVVNDFSLFPAGLNEGKAGDFWYHEDTQAYFDDADHYKMIRAMCRLSCSVCDNAEDQVALAAQAKRKSKFRSIDQLKGHLFHAHRVHMCNLCLEGRKVFICEQKLYSRSQLTKHMKTGDSEVDGSEVERSGFAGHPVCEFCKTSFYGDNELYTHMSREHYSCHICQRQHPAQYDYFRNYDDLELHFRKDHFLCEDEACLAKKFVVFPSEAELKRHNAMEHGGRMSRAQRNAALQIPTSFIYRRNEQDQRLGRGRGRNAHHDGTESHIPSSQNGRATADGVDNVSGSLQSLSVGSSSAGAEISSRTGQALEHFSFPPLSDPDVPDTKVDSVPDETSFPSLSEQQSRYALALNQSARATARLADESLFPPLPGSSNSRAPASAQQGLQSLAKSTLAARLQQRSKGPVKVLNTARPRPSENPELLPSSTQAWPTPDQGLLVSGSSQLRIGTQTRENGFMPAVSSNSVWNPIAPNKMKHPVSTPNLVSVGSSGQMSSTTAYGSNRSQALPVAEVVRAANKSLVERMRSALGMDEDRYSAFKEIAGEYRQGIIDTSEYLSYVEQFGLSHLVPEMARLLPDPQKQRELADAYYTNIRFKSLQENGGGGTTSQEASHKKKGKGKAPVSESSAAKDVKDALADNFLDTVRRLQSNHQAQEGEAEVLSKDGYRPSKGVQLSAGSSSSVDSNTGLNSKASGAKDNVGSSSKQPKKTSKFLRARLGDNSLATLDVSRPSASPERPERESQGPQMGLPVRGAWKNGGGQKLFSSNGRK